MIGIENIKHSTNNMKDKSLFYFREKNGKRTLTKQGQAVLWYMQKVIGVSEITESNWKEVFERIESFEDKFGAVVVFWENNKPISNYIEQDEIKSMIGLKLKEPEEELDDNQWENKFNNLLKERNAEEKRIADQFDEIPDNANIEYLAPGAEIHTQPIISMPEVAGKK